MDTTAIAGEQSQDEGDLPLGEACWKTALYDDLLRQALGDHVLGHDQTVAGPLTGNELLRAYTVARVSREIDTRERALQAQGRAWFSIAGAGKEVMGWAFARHLKP